MWEKGRGTREGTEIGFGAWIFWDIGDKETLRYTLMGTTIPKGHVDFQLMERNSFCLRYEAEILLVGLFVFPLGENQIPPHRWRQNPDRQAKDG